MSDPLKPRRPAVEALEPRRLLSAVFDSVGSQPVGPLTGKIVFTSAGHGLTANGDDTWSTQRGETNEIVEDFGNQDQTTFYVDELWRAGATVVSMRPVGHQPVEVVVDDQQALFTGSWGNGASTPYYSNTNGSGTKYKFAIGSATETAVARYTPNLPVAGYYPVYAWALDGSNRATDQLYRVVHAGGATEVKINHQRVGKGWIYLGTYYFNAGTDGRVEISNKTAQAGTSVIIADAIRFGNGYGDVVRGNRSGALREDEAALYWIEAMRGFTAPGVPASNSSYGTSTVSAPSRYAAYMYGPFAEALYLGWHTNAGGGRGTVGLYNNESLFPNTATPNQFRWAQLVGKEINDDFVALGSPPLEVAWSNRTNPTFARGDFAFGEISSSATGDEFDATIIEVAFHDSVDDARLLRDPNVRRIAAQSATQATIRYFNQFSNAPLVFAPDAPTGVTVVRNADDTVTVSWQPAEYRSFLGGIPSGYIVYGSRDGKSFDAGRYVAGYGSQSLTLSASQVGTDIAYFKVAAVNAGGVSPASAVVAVRAGNRRVGRVLIVDGFDRLDRFLNPTQTIDITNTFEGNTAAGVTIERVRPRFSNSYDYVIQHAEAIAAHPGRIGFDTADNAAVIAGRVSLDDYETVIWFLGEESSADKTFDATERSLVQSYIAKGGKLLVSGAEVGYELVGQGVSPTFFTSTLRAGYVGDDANTYTAAGVSGSIFAGISLNFDNGQNTYDVNYPDRLSASNGSSVVMNYVGGSGGGAATAWSDAVSGARTIVMGFPFETIVDAVDRNAVMTAALNFFGTANVRPGQLNPLTKVRPVDLRKVQLAKAGPKTNVSQTILDKQAAGVDSPTTLL